MTFTVFRLLLTLALLVVSSLPAAGDRVFLRPITTSSPLVKRHPVRYSSTLVKIPVPRTSLDIRVDNTFPALPMPGCTVTVGGVTAVEQGGLGHYQISNVRYGLEVVVCAYCGIGNAGKLVDITGQNTFFILTKGTFGGAKCP